MGAYYYILLTFTSHKSGIVEVYVIQFFSTRNKKMTLGIKKALASYVRSDLYEKQSALFAFERGGKGNVLAQG